MKHRYLEILLFSIFIISCEEDVTVTIKKKQNTLAVDGFITDSIGYNYIKLYMVQDYYRNKIDSVSGAIVFITCQSDTFKFTERNFTKGSYTNENFKGLAGQVYNLKIIWRNQHYEASSELVKTKNSFSLEPSLFVDAEINVNYTYDSIRYRYLTYVNDTLKEGFEWFWIIPAYSGFYGVFFPIKYTACTYKIRVERQSLDSISHNYFKELFNYVQVNTGTYMNPPDFPKGNISNNAVGIFRASSVSSREIIIKH